VSEHDQFRELIEGYALGALDQAERAELGTHLASGCAECAAELAEARWLVTQLVYLAPAAEPSEMLRARLLRTVRGESGASSAANAARVPAKSAIPLWMWAGVAALLLVTAYSTWNAKHMSDKVATLNVQVSNALKEREQLHQELTATKHEAVILTAPESKKFMIWPNDKQMPNL
jgi:anti-sigma factor RsiW